MKHQKNKHFGMLATTFGLISLNLLLQKHVRYKCRHLCGVAIAQRVLDQKRGREQVLDEVRLFAHGPLQAHIVALQHCLTLAEASSPNENKGWVQQAQTQARLLQRHVLRLYAGATQNDLQIHLEHSVRDITESLRAMRPACNCRVEVLGYASAQLPIGGQQALMLVLYNALQNVFQHAHPSSVLVQLQYAPDATILVVADDGCGFAIDQPRSNGHGLHDMRKVVHQQDGTFAIESLMGRGTRITAVFPYTRLQRSKGA